MTHDEAVIEIDRLAGIAEARQSKCSVWRPTFEFLSEAELTAFHNAKQSMRRSGQERELAKKRLKAKIAARNAARYLAAA